jgi:hypothetical protein
MTAELRALLEAQWKVTRALRHEHGKICPWVFHRDGMPIRSLRKACQAACIKAGYPGRIPSRSQAHSGQKYGSGWHS